LFLSIGSIKNNRITKKYILKITHLKPWVDYYPNKTNKIFSSINSTNYSTPENPYSSNTLNSHLKHPIFHLNYIKYQINHLKYHLTHLKYQINHHKYLKYQINHPKYQHKYKVKIITIHWLIKRRKSIKIILMVKIRRISIMIKIKVRHWNGQCQWNSCKNNLYLSLTKHTQNKLY